MIKKLFFVAPSAYPLGGVADWLDYLLPGLVKRGWECVLGLVEGHHHDAKDYLGCHPWQPSIKIENATGSREGRINALIKSIEKACPDIVAIVNIVDAYEAVRRIRLRGKESPRIVATLHGLQSDLLNDIRVEADVIDAVIATNRLSAKLAGQALQCEERVFYAPCGVPISAVNDLAQRTSQPLTLLYSGRLEQEQKRILDLPDLLISLRDIGIDARLAIAGGGPNEDELRNKVSALRLYDRVDFLGVLDAATLAQEYQRHDALIITSTWETGPIVAWEAMSYGLPVLSSRYVGSGLEGALADGENCLLFPIGDMQVAAYATSRLLDPEIRTRLIRGGLDLVQSRYSREASVMQWDQALELVLRLPRLIIPRASPAPLPSGRLDKWLGAEMGEIVRRTLGISYKHRDPGGEWPHSRHLNQDRDVFLARIAELDGSLS